MALFSRFLHTHDLIISIGSGMVSGAVVELSGSKPPVILHTYESTFPIKAEVNADNLASHMLSALHVVGMSLHKAHKRNIRQVHIIFSSPWFSSSSRSLVIKKDAPFTVTEKVVEKLVNENVQTALTDLSKSGYHVIENSVSHMRLNGYETENPYGKTASTVDVSLYVGTVPAVLKEKVESEIYTIIHPHAVFFHTFPFVSWNVITTLFSPKEDFLFIDIGSEVSDILLVRRGSIQTIGSFPIGKNHLVRKVSAHFETVPELSLSMISMFANDAAAPDIKERIGTLVNAYSEEWRLRLEQTIHGTQAHDEGFTPQKAFYVSDFHVSGIFKDVISKEVPNTIFLSQENLSHFVEFSKTAVPNIFTSLMAIYLGKKELNTISVYKDEHHFVK